MVESNPHFQKGREALAATYGLLGRIDDAEWEGAEILTLQPDFTLADVRRRVPYKNSADLERWIGGLRKAGLPE